MSKTYTDSVEVTNDEMKEMLDTAPVSPVETKGKKNVFSRILAVLLAVAPIVIVCLFAVPLVLAAKKDYVIQEDLTLLDAFLALFSKNGAADLYKGIEGGPAEIEKLFGFLPVFTSFRAIGKGLSVAIYFFPVAMVFSVIFMIVAIFSGKKAPCMVRAIAFMNTFLYGAYSLAIWAISRHFGLGNVFSYPILGIVGASLLIYVAYGFSKAGAKTWLTLFLFIFTLAFSGAYVYFYVFTENLEAAVATMITSTEKSLIPGLKAGMFFRYFILAFTAVSVFNFFVSLIRVGAKKGLVFDIIRYVFSLIFAGFAVYFAFTVDAVKDIENIVIFAAAAAGVALLQIVICAIAKGVSSKKAKNAAAAVETEEEPEEEAVVVEDYTVPVVEDAPVVEETVAEEEEEEVGVYAEAVPYDYAVEEDNLGEVESETAEEDAVAETVEAEVETVEEETPAEEPVAPVAPAGYDFYNSKSFDPFIASLNNEEREQFTNIFILKYQGETKNLPDYEVGGDNTEFFRKVFIFLGQYRDRIPDSLLAKMYQFAVKR